jgi:hypothetical protein
MKKYNIIKADVESDKEIIISILKRNFLQWTDILNSLKYDFSFKECPYGYALCWLARFESTNSFVGTVSLFPRRLLINEKTIYSGQIGDFAVDKDHRGFGPALKLHREVLSKTNNYGYDLIWAVPNKDATPILFRVGYKEIGKFSLFMKPLKTRIIPKKYLPQNIQSSILLNIIDFFAGIVSKEKRFNDKSGYSIEIPDKFDERFDILWQKASKQFNICAERSSKYLNWRYKYSYSLRDYKIFCLINNAKELVGYMVFSIKDNICFISDMLFLPTDDSIDLLLAKFLLCMKAQNVGAIAFFYMGCSFIKEKLREFNFFQLKYDEKRVVVCSFYDSFEPYILDENNWYFLSGDYEH